MNRRSIEKKLFFLVLSAGILSFLALSGLTFYAMNLMRDEISELGDEVGKAGANFTENVMEYQIKKNISELAKARAELIDDEIDLISQDVAILASHMTEIASNPQNYKPVHLLNPQFEPVFNTDTYLTYGPDVFQYGLTPELEREIGIAGNIRSVLKPLAKSFSSYKSSCYVGSKHGYFICSSVFPDRKTALPFEENEFFEYDPRERPWYKIALNANKPVFSDLYAHMNISQYQLIGCSAPYFDRDGVAGVVGIDVANNEIYSAIAETSIGDNGFSFVLNDKGEIIFSSRSSGELSTTLEGGDLRKNPEKSLADAARKMVDAQSGILPVKVEGEDYYLAFAPMKNIGWSFATLTPKKDILDAAEESRNFFLAEINSFKLRLQNEFFVLTLAGLILLACLLYILFRSSKKVSALFVQPINELSDGARNIASGDLDLKFNIRTGDEIEHLAVCFNAMTAELKTYIKNLTKITADKERIATELNVAAEIQNGLLPKDFPARSDFEILATMTPAKEVGGDFYDFYFLDENHLVITIADVSGKGIPAALFMVISKTVLKNFTVSGHMDGLAQVVAEANDKLCANNDAMMFVTAFIGVLDLESGEFIFVNGGHNPPVIYRAEDNRCEFLDVKKNFVLGPMDGIPFAEQKITLSKGDLIFIYTDGVTEALNVADEEYLPDRLIAFMNQTDCRADLQTLLKNIRADVSAHVGEAEQSDDITMFALRFNGD